MKKIRVGILGAASYASGELIKLLTNHPHVTITCLVSETHSNKTVEKCHNFLKDMCDVKFTTLGENNSLEQLKTECDVIFMSKPHNYSSKHMNKLNNSNVKVIDLSGDFRLNNPALYQQWYNFKHEFPQILNEFVYGLPEINREKIKNSKYVANPGCYATSILLGIAPLVKYDLINLDQIIVNSISGASGAGKSPKAGFMYIDLVDNIRPYKIGTHQHTPEIEQELSKLAGNKNVNVLFVPHVGSFKVGIMSTIFCQLNKILSFEKVFSYYNEFYKGECFIRLFEKDQIPEISTAEGTNFCDIGISINSKTNYCIITSVIDNTIKGAAGQAVQNFNILFNFPEFTGLPNANLIQKRQEKTIKTIYGNGSLGTC